MLSKLCFVVTPKANDTVQLGIAEPAGSDVTNTPIFESHMALKIKLESVGLPGEIAFEVGLSEPRRVSHLQLVSLGFF